MAIFFNGDDFSGYPDRELPLDQYLMTNNCSANEHKVVTSSDSIYEY